jgi:hypothetical protein
MDIQTAQHESRSVFINGSVGQAVSGLIWLVSAVLATWVSTQAGIIVLVFGGMAIFPLTQLALRLIGHRASLSRENPFNALAMQVAFIVPLLLPVIYMAARGNINWFYPAFMIVVGAHYLPFMTLYGMWQFAILGGGLITGGVALGIFAPHLFTPGGWLTAVALLLFAGFAWKLRKD